MASNPKEDTENGLYIFRRHKNEWEYVTMSQLPINDQRRIRTDVFCTIFSSIFALTMLIMAAIVFKPQQIIKITYPTDQQGRHCTLDARAYNYLYFTSKNDPNKRLCVKSCPKGNQKKLQCWPTEQISCGINLDKDHQVQIYPTIPQATSIGLFCLPEDPVLKVQMLHNANLVSRFEFVETYRTIWMSVLISLGAGVIYILYVRFFTNIAVVSIISLGGIGSISMGITFLILKSNLPPALQALKIVLCVLMIILGLFVLHSLIREGKDLQLISIYLNQATTCLSDFKGLVLLIPLFLILMLGLVTLFGFQLLAYWSNSKLNHYPNEVYDIPEGLFSDITTIFNFIELIWGFSFLKETFSFIVSGTTVSWFFLRQHYFLLGVKNLFKFHWGSVVAGSFLLVFFYVADIFYDIIKPSSRNNAGCYRCFIKMFGFMDKFLGLVRSESMAYINITGIPYCNASRCVEKMCFESTMFEGSQSIYRFFRISSHVLLALFGTIYSVFYMQSALETPHVPALLFIFLLNIFVVTFFVSLPTDMAEALITCTLVKNFLEEVHEGKSYTSPRIMYKQ